MQRLSSLSLRMAAEPTRLVQVPWWSRAWAWLERMVAESSPSPTPRRTRARPAAAVVVAAAVPKMALGEDPSQTQIDPTLVLETTRALVPVPLADASSPHARAIYARAERRAQEQARRATPTANARTPLPRDDTPVLATLVPRTRPGSPARTTRAAERDLTAVARGPTPPAPPMRARGDGAPTARTECGVLAARPHTPDVVERFTASLRHTPRAATIAERDALAVRPARAVVHTSTPCAVPVYASETYVHERG